MLIFHIIYIYTSKNLKIFENIENISLFLRLQYFILPSVDINMPPSEEVEFYKQTILELQKKNESLEKENESLEKKNESLEKGSLELEKALEYLKNKNKEEEEATANSWPPTASSGLWSRRRNICWSSWTRRSPNLKQSRRICPSPPSNCRTPGRRRRRRANMWPGWRRTGRRC